MRTDEIFHHVGGWFLGVWEAVWDGGKFHIKGIIRAFRR